jgi:hypothetical protein
MFEDMSNSTKEPLANCNLGDKSMLNFLESLRRSSWVKAVVTSSSTPSFLQQQSGGAARALEQDSLGNVPLSLEIFQVEQVIP